ncbi:hypothetical protein [Kitasatospora sp. NRRL B-11411]|uniref:hypothetical protein n=1 Tax=Kitasatospora sp. NRRL B-11411 TaxID=1463822 RepID=UPI0004C2E78B|nr:hypothetical protein [Kitasatospora sp. NRRL B-11411]
MTPARAEQQIRELAEQAGEGPVIDRLIPAFHEGDVYWFLWPTVGGDLCWGEHAPLGLVRGCYADKDLSAGSTPMLKGLIGPSFIDDGAWAMVFFVDQEKVDNLTCNGVSLPLTEVGTLRTPAGTRTFYTTVAPWAVSGTMPAEVVREGAKATDHLTLLPGSAPKGDPRFRECE